MISARAGLVALALLVVPAVAPAQSNHVETTIPYRLDQSTKLAAKVGPVMIDNVKITNMGRGFGRGGFGPKGFQPSEGSTTLRFAFDVNNPGEDWEVTFTLELYDKAGKLIDRVSKKHNWEEKAETWNIDHPILEYVLPRATHLKAIVFECERNPIPDCRPGFERIADLLTRHHLHREP